MFLKCLQNILRASKKQKFVKTNILEMFKETETETILEASENFQSLQNDLKEQIISLNVHEASENLQSLQNIHVSYVISYNPHKTHPASFPQWNVASVTVKWWVNTPNGWNWVWSPQYAPGPRAEIPDWPLWSRIRMVPSWGRTDTSKERLARSERVSVLSTNTFNTHEKNLHEFV